MATNKAAQDALGGWVQTQQKIWEDWLAMLQRGSSSAELWAGTIDQWESSVRQALDAERESMRAWAAKAAVMPDAPEPVRKWADDGVEVAERWTAAQGQLWEQWFALVRKAASTTPPADKPNEAFMRAWQDAAHQMLEAQGRWSKTFGASAEGAGSGKS